ncbi:cell surface protein SprA [Parafilimonas sp.]|uniref:T9SS outer membrane translocon Sov/SprA n=1 Tax=Parafilimonas sp. TaxID=1969739 RepID=UPI0039E223C6
MGDTSLHDSLRYPLQDRRGDRFSWDYANPFDLNDTAFIKQNIEYDPLTNQYYITEKIGDIIYRKPTYLTFDEMYRLQSQMQEDDYFSQRGEALLDLNRKISRPTPRVYNKLFNRMFGQDTGNLKIDIKPQGTIDLKMGYQGQVIQNPSLSESARKSGGLDFDMSTNLNINASIGDKLKLPISYNTLANFDYENQLKLDYKGMDDEILKSVEAGNISFQTKSSLMSSPQSLFGVKTQLQFGKLYVTAAIASQKSEQKSISLSGSGVSQSVDKKLDDYDENRHFLLAQYFKNNYNKAMSNLPVVNSQVQIVRMEVWVTNRTSATTNVRTVVGLADLGESSPANSNIHAITSDLLPKNTTNDLYATLTGNSSFRDPSLVNTLLTARGFKAVNDYEKTFARKLDSTEYYYNPKVGFLSLNTQLSSDDVLAVAYQYTYNGKVYQVGEFAQDVTIDSSTGIQKVVFLKLLKATAQRVKLPIWNLMMKNVYSLDITGMDSANCKLNVLYKEPGGGTKRYLPVSAADVSGTTLIRILGADRLNTRNDPQPDGYFDYIDGYTVISAHGKIIFPVLEPFGQDLADRAFQGVNQDTVNEYVYYPLYDSIKTVAQTYTNLNRYVLQGTVKGSSSNQISLGAFNIPQGSVTVTAGSQTLTENVDYVIDYNLGTLTIINQALINSGVTLNVDFEDNSTYGSQQRSFFGLRFDYLANKHFSIGGTFERLAEKPYYTKVSYGEDPISNNMYGLDFNYQNEWPGLTRLLNKLPFYSTTAASSISAHGEMAALQPGHASQIGEGSSGAVYIDDFESATSTTDIRYPLTSWKLASTPSSFTESSLSNDLDYGKNRAKLAWYMIEPILQQKSNANNPLKSNLKELSDPRVRQVYTSELFPNRTTNITNVLTTTFDLAYYPTDQGPYNFTDDKADLTDEGKLRNPKERWGGIMRSLDQTDFETGNVQYIEFWVQNPFIKNPTSTGGKLYINLGNVSEDILKDGRRFYENGLPTPSTSATVAYSVWGRSPLNPVQLTNAFSSDESERSYQDLGFDGEADDSERVKRSSYLTSLASNFGTSSSVYQKAYTDPASDDYKWYRDDSYTSAGTGILGRYKDYNNPQGNSPVYSGTSQFSPAATSYPDDEDLNDDNTLNETESYYEYEIDLQPGMSAASNAYIVDERTVTPKLADGSTTTEEWYLFRVPVDEYTSTTGDISDFKSIRFIRMYLSGFEDSVVLRFATLNMVRNLWRTFGYEVDTTGSYTQLSSTSTTTMDVSSVNIEENSSRQPIPYVIPPGIERTQELSSNGVTLLQNEQAMSLQIDNLQKNESRAVFKTCDLDLRRYGKLDMFIHAESGLTQSPALTDGQISAVIRIGQDFLENYYEIKIPLTITPYSSSTASQIWPDSNDLNLTLNDLVQLKVRRNAASVTKTQYYSEQIGNRVYSIKGNPNLGEVEGILVAIKNETTSAISTEVWLNELRLSDLDEKGGYAALGRVDMQLADLGTLSLSANTYTYGFGSIEDGVNDRATDNMLQYDAALNIDAGKLLPQKSGLSIPVYTSINKTILTPEYDPYDLDILYKDKLKMATTQRERDSIKNAALDISTTKTINFTNMRFVQGSRRPRLWSISNFDFNYSYTEFDQTNSTILLSHTKTYRAAIGYTFNTASKFKEPFKKLIKNKSNWLAPIKDFNFNLMPSLLSFKYDVNRQFGMYIPRVVNTYDSKVEETDTTYDKYFDFDRYYNLRWDLTRSLNLDFSATAYARVDEPDGLLNTKAKKDSVRTNFFRGGRNTLYQQKSAISYNFPFGKLPLTDWITGRYSYAAAYNWTAASLLATSLGNTIENSQQNSLAAEFDLTRLYAKSKFLNAISQPEDTNTVSPARGSIQPPKPRAEIIRDSAGNKLRGAAKRHALQKWRQQKRDYRTQLRNNRQVSGPAGPVKAAAQLLTMVKHASLSYNETYSSQVPGITTGTGWLGQDQKNNQPGYAYIFGRQPDTNWLNQKARQGIITTDTTFNLYYYQDFQQQLNLAVQLQPIPDLTIDLTLQKTLSKNYSELFKNTSSSGTDVVFSHLSPSAGGGFSASYISFKTLFKKTSPDQVSGTFKKFQDYRLIIANRLAKANPYWDKTYLSDSFPTGYGRYQQDVLLPAFIAAYTGKDPNTVSLINENNSGIKSNPFKGIHALPNWRLTYTGLTKMAGLSDIFSNITITHGYSSTFAMGSFTSSLLYTDSLHLKQPSYIDSTSGNFVSYYIIPSLTIQEQFSPLIGLDVTTNDQTSVRFSYSKGRTLSLSLTDYAITEVNTNAFSFGGSFRQKGVNMPFKLPFIKVDPTKTEMKASLDFSFSNSFQTNSVLDQSSAYTTSGQKTIVIQPSIGYLINNRIDLTLYFEQQRIIPYISSSAPVITTSAGIEARISIAPDK